MPLLLPFPLEITPAIAGEISFCFFFNLHRYFVRSAYYVLSLYLSVEFLLLFFSFLWLRVILTTTDEILYLYRYSIRSILPFHSLHFLSESRFASLVFSFSPDIIISFFFLEKTNPSILPFNITSTYIRALDTFDIWSFFVSISRLSFDKLLDKWIINISIVKKIGPKFWRVTPSMNTLTKNLGKLTREKQLRK